MRKVVAIVTRQGAFVAMCTNEHTAPCKREGYPTGQGYELCAGCDYPNHAERKAVFHARPGDHVLLIGHSYACDPCKEAMNKAGLTFEIIPNVR